MLCIHASKGPDIIMHQSESIDNSPFKDPYSHPIHTCFPVIASNHAGSEGNQRADADAPSSDIAVSLL